MNNSKGFTLAEMMVASLMLIVAIAGAMSFFIFQSSRGADATKQKDARQSVALALSVMRRDIELAALGTSSTDALPVVIAANGSPGVNPDVFYVSYDTFMDWSYDIDNLTDKNSIFRGSPGDAVVSSSGSFVYKMLPATMTVTHDTRQVGGFIVTGAGNVTSVVDVDWTNLSNDRPAATQNWTVYLKTGQSASGTVVPAIRYEIVPAPVGTPALLQTQPTSELRRNDLRLAGGTYDLDVYNLTIRDRSYKDPANPGAILATGLSYEVIVQYQVRGSKSKGEYTSLGRYSASPPVNLTGKKTWIPGLVRVRAECRRYTSNQRVQ